MSRENRLANASRPLESFWHGAVRPSWSATVLTLLFCVVTLWASTKWVTQSFFLRHANQWRCCEADDALDVTVRSLRLAELVHPTDLIAIVGDRRHSSSLSMDALSRVPRESAPATEIVDLTTSGQTIWESVALIDRLPMTAQGTLILDVSLPRFQVSTTVLDEVVRHPRLGVRSRAFDSEVQKAKRKANALFGNFLLDNQAFLRSRLGCLARNLVLSPSWSGGSRRQSLEWPRTSDPATVDAVRDILKRLLERLQRKSRLACLLVDYSNVDSTDPRKESEAVLQQSHRRFLQNLTQPDRIVLVETRDAPTEAITDQLRRLNESLRAH